MTQHEQRDNSGIIFRNDRKSGETDRDYAGSATIAGVEYWMSAWIKESKTGSKFMTFSFKAKDAPKPASVKPTAEHSGAGLPFDDPIPF